VFPPELLSALGTFGTPTALVAWIVYSWSQSRATDEKVRLLYKIIVENSAEAAFSAGLTKHGSGLYPTEAWNLLLPGDLRLRMESSVKVAVRSCLRNNMDAIDATAQAVMDTMQKYDKDLDKLNIDREKRLRAQVIGVLEAIATKEASK
jgi:hypothetical protein